MFKSLFHLFISAFETKLKICWIKWKFFIFFVFGCFWLLNENENVESNEFFKERFQRWIWRGTGTLSVKFHLKFNKFSFSSLNCAQNKCNFIGLLRNFGQLSKQMQRKLILASTSYVVINYFSVFKSVSLCFYNNIELKLIAKFHKIKKKLQQKKVQ